MMAKIIEVTSTDFPNAVQLPNKKRDWVKGTNKSSPSGNSGNKKKKAGRAAQKGAGLQIAAQALTAARAETLENKRVLVIGPDGKRRFMRVTAYEQSRHHRESMQPAGASGNRGDDRLVPESAEADGDS